MGHRIEGGADLDVTVGMDAPVPTSKRAKRSAGNGRSAGRSTARKWAMQGMQVHPGLLRLADSSDRRNARDFCLETREYHWLRSRAEQSAQRLAAVRACNGRKASDAIRNTSAGRAS
jgi:hypothetical protein